MNAIKSIWRASSSSMSPMKTCRLRIRTCWRHSENRRFPLLAMMKITRLFGEMLKLMNEWDEIGLNIACNIQRKIPKTNEIKFKTNLKCRLHLDFTDNRIDRCSNNNKIWFDFLTSESKISNDYNQQSNVISLIFKNSIGQFLYIQFVSKSIKNWLLSSFCMS